MRATITFVDKPDGRVAATLEFDPPLSNEEGALLTNAQELAVKALQFALGASDDVEE